jgi:hypothetical protein
MYKDNSFNTILVLGKKRKFQINGNISNNETGRFKEQKPNENGASISMADTNKTREVKTKTLSFFDVILYSNSTEFFRRV